MNAFDKRYTDFLSFIIYPAGIQPIHENKTAYKTETLTSSEFPVIDFNRPYFDFCIN